jgi:hypothetical protein
MSDDAVVGWLLRTRGHSDHVPSRGHVYDLHTTPTDHVVVRQLSARDMGDILVSVDQCIEGIEVQLQAEMRHRILMFAAYPEEGIAADDDREEDLPIGHPSRLVYGLRIEVSWSSKGQTDRQDGMRWDDDTVAADA